MEWADEERFDGSVARAYFRHTNSRDANDIMLAENGAW